MLDEEPQKILFPKTKNPNHNRERSFDGEDEEDHTGRDLHVDDEYHKIAYKRGRRTYPKNTGDNEMMQNPETPKRRC